MAIEAAPPLDTAFEVKLPPAPYPGLRPFETQEWPIFFGREAMTDEVIKRLVHQHVVVVHGDSGCGKSSLIRAGVLAQLEQEHARSGVTWRTCAMLPREAPLRNLAKAFAELDASEGDRNRIRQIRRILNDGRDAPAVLAKLLRRGDDDHICILVDQFEELFTFARADGREEAQLFVDILVGLQAKPPPGLYAILTMRSEFLGVCARFKGQAEAVNKTQYLLPQMERPALMRAICEPATLYDGAVSRELAERLIVDAGGGQDQLPLIQHGLMVLWRNKVGAPRGLAEAGASFTLAEPGAPYRGDGGAGWRLGLKDYQSSGGLDVLLSNHADEVMAKAVRDPGEADPDREKVVEHLFRALIDINAEGQAIRRPQTFGDLMATTGCGEQTLREIIALFRAEGVSFLSPYGDGAIEARTLIDISHEALIRCWGKIAHEKGGWLQKEFQDGLIWKFLRLEAEEGGTLSAVATSNRDEWLKALPSADWCERYGGGWVDVQQLMERSRRARDAEARRLQELEEARRREAVGQMREHLKEARRLLVLANRKGVRIPDHVLAPVVEVDRVLNAERIITLDLETRFWNAYGILRNTIEPATRARRLYRCVFYGSLALVLVCQSFFLFGSTVHEQLTLLRAQSVVLSGELQALGEPAPGDVATAAAAELRESITHRIEQNQRDREAYGKLAAELLWLPAEQLEGSLATLEVVLEFLATYLLPALYGLLGACAFVLRQLSADISQLRFANDLRPRYTLRLNIGLLAGLAIGWFISPGQSATVGANLWPLALAFVAGYGSDLLFAVLDRIVSSLSRQLVTRSAAGSRWRWPARR
jgi:hypothetical protein